MKQLLQIYRTGQLLLPEVPLPRPASNQVLVRTVASLVSVGTERHLLEFAQKSLLSKALARPDLVRQVIAKARLEGIKEAWRQALARLDAPVPLGYSSAGVVIGLGSETLGFALGDRVACTGSGFASHAEGVRVPANLCTRIPDSLEFEQAAFAAVGGIALQAVRMAQVTLGCRVAVIGLGLLGQLAVQLLRAAGCHVVGMDLDPRKAEMALQHGAEAAATDYDQLRSLVPASQSFAGFDSVIIFAATASNEPLEQAAEICREGGRVVATGLVGLNVPRKSFYDKELELVVSRAWGPGIYDPSYTEGGLDYPLPYARWTAKRNVEEFLAQLAMGKVEVNDLVSHRFDFSQCLRAYELILSGEEPYMGILLKFPEKELRSGAGTTVWLSHASAVRATSPRARIGIGVIGAGLFAKGTILPILKGLAGVRLRGMCTRSGLTARHAAEAFRFEYCTSDYRKLLEDSEIGLIFVLTRHGSHSGLAAEALRAGKHVFVEKPLALTIDQLRQLLNAFEASNGCHPVLMVGFNRRFSPFAKWLRDGFSGVREPLAVQCIVNAGPVPPDSWVYDAADGGGRILGEVCHFVDLVQYITGSLPQRVFAESLNSSQAQPSDNLVITLKMANGSLGCITYLSGGDKAYPRERVEVYGGGMVGVIENFNSATLIHRGRKKRLRNYFTVDRGHRAEIEAVVDAVRQGGAPPVPLQEYIWTTLASFAIEDSLRWAAPIEVDLAALNLTGSAAEDQVTA
jgi:predicted dehydrogenase